MAEQAEQEILDARRAFPKAQELLGGEVDRRLPGTIAVGWYDSRVSGENGAFAVVRLGGPYDDLIGEILRVSADDRTVFVYVLGRGAVPTDLALARRAFLDLGVLALESLDCTVETVL